MTPRLYLDEDISTKLAGALRDNHIDTISAHEIGTEGQPDEEQIRIATSLGRTLVTWNFSDFARVHEERAVAGEDHAGIVISYRQYSRRELGEAARRLVRLCTSLDELTMRNALIILDSFA